jgi:O-antigen ligase
LPRHSDSEGGSLGVEHLTSYWEIFLCYNNSMNKILKYILFLVTLTPLFIDKLVFIPFISAKNFFFRTIICLISILIIYGFIFMNKFRNEIIGKIKIFFKNQLFRSILIFVLLVEVSTIFAFDKYTAFWGTLERGEGMVVMIYSFALLVYLLFFFEKKDWLSFFKISLFVSIVVLLKEFYQFFVLGLGRPESFLGNPTFLAGYLIFSLMFSAILFSEENKKIWKYFSIVTLILSVLGIFIAETRGTILGLAVGVFFVLIYSIIKGKHINYKKLNLRKVSIIILLLSIVFSGVFIVTRKSEIWQKVPGLSRVAVISLKDSTTSTRLLTQKISLQASNPKDNGLKNFLIGYGQDNFSYAYGKYFNPVQFEDEMKWFDRSHNKFLDILVMNGIFGFLAYLSIFVLCFIYLFKKKDFTYTTAGLLFGFTAYLTHLFFVFDQPTTYIMLFASLAFIIYINSDNSKFDIFLKIKNSKKEVFGIILLFIITISSIFIYFRNDLIAYLQMRKFSSLVETGNAAIVWKNIDSVFYPFTVSRSNIIIELFNITKNKFDKNDNDIIRLSEVATLWGGEYLNKNPKDLRFLFYFANDCIYKGRKLNNLDLLKKGETYLRKSINFAPNRPEFNYSLAINLFYQNKFDEAFFYLEKAFDLSPEYYIKNKDNSKIMYYFYIKYFFERKDLNNLEKIFYRIKENNSTESMTLGKIIDYIKKTKTWPSVRFE